MDRTPVLFLCSFLSPAFETIGQFLNWQFLPDFALVIESDGLANVFKVQAAVNFAVVSLHSAFLFGILPPEVLFWSLVLD